MAADTLRTITQPRAYISISDPTVIQRMSASPGKPMFTTAKSRTPVAMVAAPNTMVSRWLASSPQRARWNSFTRATAEVSVITAIQIQYMA